MSHDAAETVRTILAVPERLRADELIPVIYAELRKLAGALMARVPPGNTLEPTALVHEAYLRLVGDHDPGWNGRGHFFGAAAMAMRHLLVEQARRKAARKHGGDRRRVDLDSGVVAIRPPTEDLLELDHALTRLERTDPRSAKVVMLRYFAGLSARDTATALGISLSTVERDWRFARALLRRQLSEDAAVADGSGNGNA